MRTNKDLINAKLTFKNELLIVPKYSMFGCDNHYQINKAIELLNKTDFYYQLNKMIDNLYDNDDDDLDNELISFLETLKEWYDCDIELRDIIWNESSIPSERKKPLICPKMCNDCPFSKTSTRGFLAEYNLNDIMDMKRTDFTFPCHKTVKNDTDVNLIKNKIESGEMHFCRGYVESFIKDCRIPRNNPLLEEAINIVKSQGMSENSMSQHEFNLHHDTKLYKIDVIKRHINECVLEMKIESIPSPKSLSIDEFAYDSLKRIANGLAPLALIKEVSLMISSSYYNNCITESEYKQIIKNYFENVSNLDSDGIYEESISTLFKSKFN